MESEAETREVAIGGTTTVELPGAGTTGYLWSVSSPSSVRVEKQPHPPTSPAEIGRAWPEQFAITPSRRGLSVVVFKLKRPWENRAIREQRVKLVTR